MYQQALRDLSQWVEFGVTPPATSNYTVTLDADITLPEEASQRGGIQPIVSLGFSHDGTLCISAGEEVSFPAVAETPPGNGKIVALESDFLRTGEFIMEKVVEPAEAISLHARFTYERPGDYVAVVRATSQTKGGAEVLFARVQNLRRTHVRVG